MNFCGRMARRGFQRIVPYLLISTDEYFTHSSHIPAICLLRRHLSPKGKDWGLFFHLLCSIHENTLELKLKHFLHMNHYEHLNGEKYKK
jgi:hypothetical protein